MAYSIEFEGQSSTLRYRGQEIGDSDAIAVQRLFGKKTDEAGYGFQPYPHIVTKEMTVQIAKCQRTIDPFNTKQELDDFATENWGYPVVLTCRNGNTVYATYEGRLTIQDASEGIDWWAVRLTIEVIYAS